MVVMKKVQNGYIREEETMAVSGLNPGKRIFCIIPAYNEEKSIAEVIKRVKKEVSQAVVVDDCSSDQTFMIASEAGAVVLRHAVNRGQGASLQTGIDHALRNGAGYLVHFDADGQFLAEEIKDVLGPLLSDEADVVLGSRFLEKKSDIPRFKKHIIMPLARLANQIFLGINMTDPQSGFRAFNRSASEKIIIEQDRMAHCSEILTKIHANKLRIKEVPISVVYHDFGQRLSGGFKILKELFLGSLIK